MAEEKKTYGWDEEFDSEDVDLSPKANVFPEGDYDFIVTGAEKQISKAGNNMVKLTLGVEVGEQTASVTDYIVLDSAEWAKRKLVSLFITTGFMTKGEKVKLGWFDSICGKTGKAHIKIDHDKTGTYSDKNVIGWYILRETAAAEAPKAPSKKAKAPASDLPFEV